MKKSLLAVFGIALLLILGACSSDEAAVNIKELVHEYSIGSDAEVSASITSHQLIVKDDKEKETTYDLPENEFFVSIAPYVDRTHPCAIHSLTSCQGELVEKEFDVLIKDEEGNVIVDEKMTSLANGFIDLWLPRDQKFLVTIEYDGKVTESEITTFEGDNTCITTMQLM